ncbi:MAG TPA: ATP-grasp domain-containing protein [Vicinamibacterales bacterium]|nr:ATP-grasp domain-containing protein [Vicinamibacterales bacterium]
MNVLVTDGDQRAALAITRSLGRRGMSVVVGEEDRTSLAGASRYCARPVVYPSPYQDPEAFERFVSRLVVRERLDLVIPVSDVTTHAIAKNQDALREHAALAVPPFDAFERLTDKASLMQRARKCGIPTPVTHIVDGIAGLRSIQDQISFPAVVKPTRSRIRTPDGWLGGHVHYASNQTELRKLYGETSYLASYPSLIQERIVGAGVGVFVLCDRGRVMTVFQHTRVRERPPSGGVSVLSESQAVDTRLREQATRLLEPLGWHGVAMLEYKRDHRTGTPVLMEVNGRFWGSLQLAIDAGVDFPFMSCELALGRRVSLPASYRVGHRTRWWIGDLDHLLLRLLERDGAVVGGSSKLRAVLEFVRSSAPGIRNEIMRLDDPMPACRELWHYACDLSRAAGRRLRRPILKARAGVRFRLQRER